MRDVVTTLPISPVLQPHLGLALLPWLMEQIAQGLGVGKVLALNLRGLKYDLASPQSEKVQLAHDYLAMLERLGIHPDLVWRDDLNEFGAFAQRALLDLLDRGVITIALRRVVKCPCGRVEFLSGSSAFSVRRRIFQEKGEKRICRICSGSLIEEETEVCLYRCVADPESLMAIPDFAQTELRNLAKTFSDVEFLVSRSRVTHFSLNLHGLRDFDIDPDFLWSLLIPYLGSQGYSVKYLVGSHRNLLACYLIGCLAQHFQGSGTVFVIPPFIGAPKQGSVKQFGALEDLVSTYGSDAVQAFLLSGLNWMKKETTINPSYLEHLSKLDESLLSCLLVALRPRHGTEIVGLNGISFRNALAVRKET